MNTLALLLTLLFVAVNANPLSPPQEAGVSTNSTNPNVTAILNEKLQNVYKKLASMEEEIKKLEKEQANDEDWLSSESDENDYIPEDARVGKANVKDPSKQEDEQVESSEEDSFESYETPNFLEVEKDVKAEMEKLGKVGKHPVASNEDTLSMSFDGIDYKVY